MRTRLPQLFTGVLFVVGFGLLGASLLHGVGPVHAATVGVSITGAGFDPQDLTIAPGTTVTWTNNSSSAQTVTSQLPGTDPNFFNSGFIYAGQSYSRTFSSEVTLTYKSLTSGQTGVLTVDSGAGPPPTATPTASGGGGGGGGGATVAITAGGYVPQVINIDIGTTVTWTNETSTAQTASAQVNGTDPNFFNSNFIYAGQSWSHTFTTAGTVPYKSLTTGLTGTVVIGGGGGGGGSPTNTPTPIPTNTPTPYASSTPTNPPAGTATATPTNTSTPKPGATNTPTPTKTATPTMTPTPKPGATNTPTPTKTPAGSGGGGGDPAALPPLESGWNLVTYGGAPGDAKESLAQLGSQWSAAYYWDGQQWQRYFRPGTVPSWLNNMGPVPTGSALWVLATAAIP